MIRRKLHWTYYMAGALFLIIGVLSFVACISITVKGDGSHSVDIIIDEDVNSEKENHIND